MQNIFSIVCVGHTAQRHGSIQCYFAHTVYAYITVLDIITDGHQNFSM